MSRIDQALDRARRAGSGAASLGRAPEGAPAETLFTGPWDIEERSSSRETVPDSALRPARSVFSPVHTAGDLHPDLREKTVAASETSSVAVEQYRRLTARLHHVQLERQVKRLMIISAEAGEGKTLTSVNIALTLSRSHRRRVLLVDADLRRPSLHEVFRVPGDPGLREASTAPLGAPAPIAQIDERLALLPGGKPTSDPVPALSSARTRELIAAAGEEYDWVVIDTAPLGVLSDASVLSDLVDAAVLVISAGRTPHDMVLRAVRLLGREKILGVVLNGVDERDVNIGHYAHYYTRP